MRNKLSPIEWCVIIFGLSFFFLLIAWFTMLFGIVVSIILELMK